MSFRVRLRRVLLRILGFYVAPTPSDRLYAVMGRTSVSRTQRGDRGEFTLGIGKAAL
jgi:hypothetical protein